MNTIYIVVMVCCVSLFSFAAGVYIVASITGKITAEVLRRILDTEPKK